MGTYNFSHITDRRDSLSVKWNKRAIESICNNPEALPFWVADMDFPAPPSVLSALHEQVEHGILGYPLFDTVSTIFSDWVKKRHNWTLDSSLAVPTPGMLATIALLVELLSNVGDSIIVPMPAYQPFVNIIKGLGRTLVPWPLAYDSENACFSLNIAQLEILAKGPNTPLLLFCSPHNPTGRVFTSEELHAVARIAASHALSIISDEIHADLTLFGHTHIPFDIVAKEYQLPCVTCMAPSKTFNIAGEHFSMAVCSDRILYNKLAQRMRALHLSPDLLATTTALAAYEGGYSWLMDLLSHLNKQVTYIDKRLKESKTGLRFVIPEASFIGFIDCAEKMHIIETDASKNPQLYQPSRSPSGGIASRFFGQRAKIAMNDGTWFGKDYTQFVRFNYGTSHTAIEQALDAIIAAVQLLER